MSRIIARYCPLQCKASVIFRFREVYLFFEAELLLNPKQMDERRFSERNFSPILLQHLWAERRDPMNLHYGATPRSIPATSFR